MTTLSVNIGEAVRHLSNAGLSEKQAEAIVHIIQKTEAPDMVTKHDLEQTEMRLHLKISELENRVLRWAVPLLVGQAAVFAAIVHWLG